MRALVRVYPACAGIHLSHQKGSCFIDGLPRMRGDPPILEKIEVRAVKSTPHARGSTAKPRRSHEYRGVYPACAGIHPPESL